MGDIMKIDLYALLGIGTDCTQQEIKKAYRKKALTCHPDKNADNPKAAELFRELSKALEILTDSTAKSAYDRLLSARKHNALRNTHLDAKRRKLKEDLEAREKAARNEDVISEAEASQKLAKEIERLRRDGSKQLEVEKEILRQKLEKEYNRLRTMPQTTNVNQFSECTQLKIKRLSKTTEFTEKSLREYFGKFGSISFLLISKNNKTAVLEFDRIDSAKNALKCDNKMFGVKLIKESSDTTEEVKQSETKYDVNDHSWRECDQTDYESIVLRNLRIAEERKRLIRIEETLDN